MFKHVEFKWQARATSPDLLYDLCFRLNTQILPAIKQQYVFARTFPSTKLEALKTPAFPFSILRFELNPSHCRAHFVPRNYTISSSDYSDSIEPPSKHTESIPRDGTCKFLANSTVGFQYHRHNANEVRGLLLPPPPEVEFRGNSVLRECNLIRKLRTRDEAPSGCRIYALPPGF